jgi:hypothetical protein
MQTCCRFGSVAAPPRSSRRPARSAARPHPTRQAEGRCRCNYVRCLNVLQTSACYYRLLDGGAASRTGVATGGLAGLVFNGRGTMTKARHTLEDRTTRQPGVPACGTPFAAGTTRPTPPVSVSASLGIASLGIGEIVPSGLMYLRRLDGRLASFLQCSHAPKSADRSRRLPYRRDLGRSTGAGSDTCTSPSPAKTLCRRTRMATRRRPIPRHPRAAAPSVPAPRVSGRITAVPTAITR